MDVAIMLYENFTALDAIGPYEVLSRLPGSRVTFVAQRPGPVAADTGMLTVQAEAALARHRRRTASRCWTGCGPRTRRRPG